MTLVVPRYSAPVAVADVLVVLGMATTNNAAVGKGIGKVAVRDEQYPHCLFDPEGDIKCAVKTHVPITKSCSCCCPT